MGRVRSRMKRLAAVVLSLAVVVPAGVFGTSQQAEAAGPTGAGLAAHALNAYKRAGPILTAALLPERWIAPV